MADTPYKTIVVGSDGSKSSLLAVERAAKIAAAFGSTLVIGTAYYENEEDAAKTLRQAGVPADPIRTHRGLGYALEV